MSWWDDFVNQEPFGFIKKAKPLGNAGPSISEMWEAGNDFLTPDFNLSAGSGNDDGLRSLYGDRIPSLGGQAAVQKNAAHERFAKMSSPQGTNPLQLQQRAQQRSQPYIPGPRNPQPFPNGLPVGPEEDPMAEEQQLMEDTINAIRQRLSQGFVDDGSYNAMIDEAFAGSLSAIDNARGKANTNYAASDQALENLTAGHVNAIKGEDMDAIKAIGAGNQQAISGIYDNTNKELQADRSKEIAERAEALSRYGLGEAGMGQAGQAQSQAIANTTEKKTGSLNAAQGYQAADEALNVQRAQSQAGEGVERRSSLRADLDKILGGLDNSAADVQSQKAQARLQAKNAAMQSFNQSQAADADTLEMILRDKRENNKQAAEERLAMTKANKGTSTAFDVAKSRLNAQGIDANALEQVYSQVMADNSYSSVSGKSEAAHYVSEMKKKLQKQKKDISDGALMQYVSLIQNYGTDKANATG